MQVGGFEGTEEQANFGNIITLTCRRTGPHLTGGVHSQGGIFFQAGSQGSPLSSWAPMAWTVRTTVNLGGDTVVDPPLHRRPGQQYPATEQFMIMRPALASRRSPLRPGLDASEPLRCVYRAGGSRRTATDAVAPQVTTALPQPEGSWHLVPTTFNAKGDPVQSTCALCLCR